MSFVSLAVSITGGDAYARLSRAKAGLPSEPRKSIDLAKSSERSNESPTPSQGYDFMADPALSPIYNPGLYSSPPASTDHGSSYSTPSHDSGSYGGGCDTGASGFDGGFCG